MIAGPVLAEPIAFHRWASFYAGFNAGAGSSRESYTTAPSGALLTLPYAGSLGWAQALAGSSSAGFTGGAQLGYNWQPSDQFVFGIETDVQYYGAKVNNTSSFLSSVPPALPGGFATLSNMVSSSTPWFGTLRGRVGTTVFNPSTLIYVTGGLAYGHENITASVRSTDGGGALTSIFPFNVSGTHFGYTVGGGVEWGVDAHWSVKAEYLYVSLAASSSQTVATTFLGPNALPTDTMTLSSSRDQLNVYRLGANYRF
jgi:outer membrane immunogenic protein